MKLYVVPTPIGNLQDITLRALETLKQVDIILAEDTRTSKVLLNHFQIATPLWRYHQHNEHKVLENLIEEMQAGKTFALISDAGTPAISDPGFLLVRACIQHQIPVECLPGPTALIPALVDSGFPINRFVFEGFLPPKKGRQHALYIVRELLTVEPRTRGTNIDAAIRYFNNTTGQKSIAFLLSDFLDTGYDNDLKVIGKKHDVIGIKVYDKMDLQLPDAGLLQLEDAETGKVRWIDSSSEMVRYNYQQNFFRQTDTCKRYFRSAGADLLHVRTDEDYVKILQKFFLKRK